MMKQSALKLHKFFSHGMILQRDKEITIKGQVAHSGTLKLRLGQHETSLNIEKPGPWLAHLPPLPAGGPYTLELSFGDDKILLEDILMGDLWLCSGQSNMQLTMARLLLFFPEEKDHAECPEVRFFNVPERYDLQHPCSDFDDGRWLSASKENLEQFSGVAWYFAKKLQQRLDVPVGIISSAIGGTPIQSWMSEEALRNFPEDYKKLQRFKIPAYLKEVEEKDIQQSDAWYREAGEKDPGFKKIDFTDAPEISLPGNWDGVFKQDGPGIYWFEKDVDLPAEAQGCSGTLWLGVLVDADRVWLNGSEVGRTYYQYPPRIYPIPQGLLKAGKNTLRIQLTVNQAKGYWEKEKNYRLDWDGGSVNLEGLWKIQQGASMPILPGALRAVTLPAGLFNGMIAPLEHMTLKGMVWYQGESNVEENGQDYADYLRAMLKQWRCFFQDKSLPCLITQLPLFNPSSTGPQEDGWAFIRQAQKEVSGEENNYLTVTLDLGEWNDIHPLNKKDVGERLTETALFEIYGENKAIESPKMTKLSLRDNNLVLEFSGCQQGLQTSDGKVPGHLFVKDKASWKALEARCIKNELIIANWDSQWKELYYGWADNPEGANLVNGAGIPLSPFMLNVEDEL